MENKEIAIRISNVKKMYKLGQIGGGSLQADLQSWWARIRGKEDPNTKIGTDQRLIGKTFMALNGVDLTVKKGEALGIIGGNGAGKSTLLKLLSRVTAPTEGKIQLYGRIASMLEVGTGFNGEMTGRENVYMNGAILGMTKAEIDAKMEEIIEFSEVRDFIDTPVKRYSSGMYVKLAFSVAAHLDSEIMIMDEVLAVGDMAFQKKCLDKMRDAAKKEGRTVLYVSHNMNTIRQLCDRCIVLDKGKIVFEGDVESAIGVYMDTEQNSCICIDYSSYLRPKWLINQKLRLLSVAFLNKDTNCFGAKEPMRLTMRWENLADLKDVCLRVEIVSMEGIALATYTVFDFYSGAQGAVAMMDIEMDISSFMDSTYKMRYTFFNKNNTGANADIGYAEGLCFKKSTEDSESGLLWNVNNWGHIHMPNPEIIEIKKC